MRHFVGLRQRTEEQPPEEIERGLEIAEEHRAWHVTFVAEKKAIAYEPIRYRANGDVARFLWTRWPIQGSATVNQTRAQWSDVAKHALSHHLGRSLRLRRRKKDYTSQALFSTRTNKSHPPGQRHRHAQQTERTKLDILLPTSPDSVGPADMGALRKKLVPSCIMSMNDFQRVINEVGLIPTGVLGQNSARRYSENLSKAIALWIRDLVIAKSIGPEVLKPEGRVPTIYGNKRLDVGVRNKQKYLVLDVSIKTFNFKDSRTKNYRKNFTGRFYELLGEAIDLNRSYRWATLVALIFLPEDSTTDAKTSSFARAVLQFSKALKQESDASIGFDHVYVAVHSSNGTIYFFDARQPPPANGHPQPSQRMSISAVLEAVEVTAKARASEADQAPLPKPPLVQFDDDN